MNARTVIAVAAAAVVVAFGFGLIKGALYGGRRQVAKIEKKGMQDVRKAEAARAAVDREPIGVCVRDQWCRRAD